MFRPVDASTPRPHDRDPSLRWEGRHDFPPLVGGFRASCYNALPKESVEVLVECMQEFAAKHAK